MAEEEDPANLKEWWTEFLVVVKRLATNRVYMLNLLSTIFLLLGHVGFYTFLPKYYEFGFHQTASTSGAAGGAANCVASIIGLITAGCAIQRWKPSARWLAAWGIATTIIGVIGSISLIGIGCPSLQIYGMTSNSQTETHLVSTPFLDELSCNAGCRCSKQKFSPICSIDGSTTFFSPCHANCTYTKEIGADEKAKVYEECSCVKASMEKIGNSSNLTSLWWLRNLEQNPELPPSTLISNNSSSSNAVSMSSAVEGYCPSNCQDQFIILTIVLIILGSMTSMGFLPKTLINMRVIRRRDKSAAMTLLVSAISLLAILPSPIIFGAIYDATCTIWGEKCGETLNCLVYDTQQLRTGVSLCMASFMALALIGNCGVWYLVKDLKIYENDEDEDKCRK